MSAILLTQHFGIYLQFNDISRVSCQKGPTRHAYAWQIGPFWQDTLDMNVQLLNDLGLGSEGCVVGIYMKI